MTAAEGHHAAGAELDAKTLRVAHDGHRRRVLIAIHGILTGATHPGWIDRLAHWLWLRDANVDVIKRKYGAGPFPMWNVFAKNRWLAHALANEVRPYAEDGAEIYFVTHSNGADIAVKTMRSLARSGFTTSAAVFIAAAISTDVDKNGVRDLLLKDRLGSAYAYCAPDDLALKFHVIWPYGHLGRLGFTRNGEDWPEVDPDLTPYDDQELIDRAFTRWFTGYGHGGYFDPINEEKIFARISSDLFGGEVW